MPKAMWTKLDNTDVNNALKCDQFLNQSFFIAIKKLIT